MPSVSYYKSLPRQEFSEWVEREFEAIERSIGSITGSNSVETVTEQLHTIEFGDADTFKEVDSAVPVNVVLPSDSADNVPINSTIQFYQKGAGAIIFVQGDGATLRYRVGTKSAGQYSVCWAWKQASNTWVLHGDLAANTSPTIVIPTGTLTITGLAPTVS